MTKQEQTEFLEKLMHKLKVNGIPYEQAGAVYYIVSDMLDADRLYKQCNKKFPWETQEQSTIALSDEVF